MQFSDRSLAVAAIVVSMTSALFAYLQYSSSERQFRLSALQVRPQVTYTPTFFPEMTALRVDMYLQNQNSIPAKVIYSDVALKIDDEIAKPHYYSRSSDIIYENKAGVSTLPALQGHQLAQVLGGQALLRVGTCAIYASTSPTDSRRWQIRAISDYTPGLHVPARRFIDEIEVTDSVQTCSAKVLLSEVIVSNDETGITFKLETAR